MDVPRRNRVLPTYCSCKEITNVLIKFQFNKPKNTDLKSLQNKKRRVEVNLLALSLSRTIKIIIARRGALLFPGAKKVIKNALIFMSYTLNRKCTMSPSFITYSLPSLFTRPFSLAAASEPSSIRLSKETTSALMKPLSKSE